MMAAAASPTHGTAAGFMVHVQHEAPGRRAGWSHRGRAALTGEADDGEAKARRGGTHVGWQHSEPIVGVAVHPQHHGHRRCGVRRDVAAEAAMATSGRPRVRAPPWNACLFGLQVGTLAVATRFGLTQRRTAVPVVRRASWRRRCRQRCHRCRVFAATDTVVLRERRLPGVQFRAAKLVGVAGRVPDAYLELLRAFARADDHSRGQQGSLAPAWALKILTPTHILENSRPFPS